MAKEASAPPRRDTYRRHTLCPLNSLVFIAPMLLLFQVGAAIYGTSLLAPQDLHKLLKYFGATAAYLPAVTIVLVLLLQHVFHKDPWRIQPKVLAGMFGESILWMIPLIALIHLSGRLMAHQAASGPAGERLAEGLFQQIILAVGAGIYEEFLFRLVFISMTLLIFVDIFGLKKDLFAMLAVFVGAVVFSLYHLSAEQLTSLSTFPWVEFIFRGVAGVYLGGLFIFRGFGVAVGAHAFYNLYVVFSQP